MKTLSTFFVSTLLAAAIALTPTSHANANHKTGAIIAGIAVGVLATGAIIHFSNKHKSRKVYNSYQPRRVAANKHIRWCYNRYRTYSHRTNKFHAGHGRYVTCRSPWY